LFLSQFAELSRCSAEYKDLANQAALYQLYRQGLDKRDKAIPAGTEQYMLDLAVVKTAIDQRQLLWTTYRCARVV
jgi:hypothetical protein